MTASASQDDLLFEANRSRLRGLAYRMTGSLSDADDVVQETWLRWEAADRPAIGQPAAWLTTVATRLSLDRLKGAARAREAYPGPWLPEPVVREPGPEEAAELADSLTLGFLVLMDRLAPVERAVFVLAEVFDVPYSEIAGVVGKSEAACRQIARRARTRLRGDGPRPHSSPHGADRLVLDALLAAVASGDVDGVVAQLAPDVVCLTDGGPHRRAARRPVVGPPRVARLLVNLAQRYEAHVDLRPVVVNGCAGVVLSLDGQVDLVLEIEVEDGLISALHIVRNPDKLYGLDHPAVLD